MGALELDRLTWPEVQAELEAGRDTVVIALGATEQHGRHMPLATDALIGDELAREVAERIDPFVAAPVRVGCCAHHAFVAPSLRVGCSARPLVYPGTLSLEDDRFLAIVGALIRSLTRGGFKRVV